MVSEEKAVQFHVLQSLRERPDVTELINACTPAETVSVVLHLAARVSPFDACPEFFSDVLVLVNDKKVSDHHALIPTLELEKADVPALPVGERNILLLVCCKLLCTAAKLVRN